MKKTFFCSIFLILSLFLGSSFSLETKKHPYHVGNVEAIYQPSTKKFEIIARFFLDDTESLLRNEYKKTLAIESNNATLDPYMKTYFLKNIRLKNNTKELKLNYIGYEVESESVIIYLESNQSNAPKETELWVSVLHQIFDDQINILHIKSGKKTSSTKLSYPETRFKTKF